jgi:hypothetical protein
MKIYLNDTQFDSLFNLITTDANYHEYMDARREFNGLYPAAYKDYAESWAPYIKHKYKLVYRTIDDEDSPIYYGSLYGTKSRVNMFLMRL